MINIIIPTYNGEKHLKCTLDRILEIQSIDINNLLKFTLVSNGSNDNTNSIALSYEQKLKNYGIKFFETNNGYDSNLIRALNLVSCEWFMFLGDDDLLFNNIITIAESLKSNFYDIVHLKYSFFYDTGTELNLPQINSITSISAVEFIKLYGESCTALSSNIFSSNCIPKIKNIKKTEYNWSHLSWVYQFLLDSTSRLGVSSELALEVRLGNERWNKNFGAPQISALNHLKLYRKYFSNAYPNQYELFRINRYKLLRLAQIDEDYRVRVRFAFATLREFWKEPFFVVIDFPTKLLPYRLANFLIIILMKAKKLLLLRYK